MKTIKRLFTGAVAMTALTLASCSGGQQANETKTTDQGGATKDSQEVKTYQVGTNPVFAPFEYTNEGGDILGFDIDLMDAIAKDRNVKFVYKNVPWDGIFASLESGDVDILSSAITITDERSERMDFSDPYYEITQLIVLPKGKQINNVDELKALGKIGVVGAQTGDILMQKYLGPTSEKIARYDTLPLMFKEIEAGGADAGVSDSAAILYYMKSNPDTTGYSLVKFDDFPVEKYGMAVTKGNSELLDLINTGLKNIKADGTYDEIKNKYFQGEGPTITDQVKEAADEAGEKVDELKDKTVEAIEATKDAAAATTEEVKEKTSEAWDATKEAASETGEAIKEKTSEAWDATKEAASETGAAIKEKTGAAVDATKEAGHAVAEKTSEAYDSLKEKTGEAVESTKQTASDVGAATKEMASDAVDATKEGAHKVVEATKGVINDAATSVKEATE